MLCSNPAVKGIGINTDKHNIVLKVFCKEHVDTIRISTFDIKGENE